MRTYDVIVVGAGVMGAAAAWQLASDGRRVLLVEQHAIGHDRGSSHGGSRICRITHDDAEAIRVMPATFELWRALEAETGKRVLTMTGGLFAGPAADPWIARASTALAAAGHPFELRDAVDAAAVYPQFRWPTNWQVLTQAESGILAATRAVEVLVAAAVVRGVEVREHTRVSAVIPGRDGVAVRLAPAGASGTNIGELTVEAAQVVLTAGPWTAKLLEPLLCARTALRVDADHVGARLRVTHQQIAYFPVEQPQAFAVGVCPLFIATAEPHFYGFPIHERAGEVKIALELTNGPAIDPEAPRRLDLAALEQLRELVGRHLVGVRPVVSRAELCLYTETPYRHFLIDRHPEFPQILFAAGFSGRGFKFAPGIGRLLADLAALPAGNYQSPHWLPTYALDSHL